MTAADRIIRWSTALAVLGVAVVAGVVSYEHASVLVREHGESGWTGRLFPLTVDGLIYVSFDGDAGLGAAKCPVPALARWLAANVAHGLGHGMIGAVSSRRSAAVQLAVAPESGQLSIGITVTALFRAAARARFRPCRG
jgi:hypothetical protein